METKLASGTCGICGSNLTCVLETNGQLTISGSGAMKNYLKAAAPWYKYRSSITSVMVEQGVTSIGDWAFCNCDKLTSLTISEGVTTIGVVAFYECNSLTSVIIPSSVISIGVMAFTGCQALKSITFLGNAPYRGAGAFHQVVATAYYPTNNSSWTSDVLQGYGGKLTWSVSPQTTFAVSGIKLASGTCGICGGNLTWVLETNGLLTVSGSGAMKGYSFGNAPWYKYRSSITSVMVEKGVTSIDDLAFYNCDKLTSLTISEGVTTIGTMAFHTCNSLTSVIIPSSVTSVGVMAFHRCKSLKSITFVGNAPYIGAGAFHQVVATAYYPTNNSSWTSDVLRGYDGELTWVSRHTPGSPQATSAVSSIRDVGKAVATPKVEAPKNGHTVDRNLNCTSWDDDGDDDDDLFDDDDDLFDDDDFDDDESWIAGGMPRRDSEFADINDPYDRAVLEQDMLEWDMDFAKNFWNKK